MKIVRVKIDGTMNDIDVNLKKKSIIKILEGQAISKGTSQFKELYVWNHDKKKIICYGWYDGEAGFENKHELIPNGNSPFLEDESSEILLFGDIFIVCMEKEKYIDFDVSGYGEIFSFFCGGFDDCNTSGEEDESDESDEPNTEDEDFIVNDEGEEVMFDEDDTDYSEEELDEDLNDY
tara:strand:- start:801 stop:1334 length:534 start_codon:yes stop_codon:yes gene_type:complete